MIGNFFGREKAVDGRTGAGPRSASADRFTIFGFKSWFSR